jgi:type IV pilus assembly protein PilB
MSLYQNKQLLAALAELKVVPVKQLKAAYDEAELQKKTLGEILLERNLIHQVDLVRLVADLINLPYVVLSKTHIHDEVLQTVPEILARKQLVIAFKKDELGLHLAMVNPQDAQLREFIEKKTGLTVIPYLALTGDVMDALSLYVKDVSQAFEEIIAENIQKTKGSDKVEPPIIKIVDTVIWYAYQNKASDIHLEPLENESLVRFRIDGVLHDVTSLPIDLHSQIVMRIKVMARLRIDEHQTAQDGKLQFETEHENLDLRVSVVPVTDGEKIVMRLLSERSRQLSLQDLGMSQVSLEKVTTAYERPHGMILSTGPTGSGKTTSLYSILKVLNKKDVNIMTIEDPVEYDLERINQIQVNAKTELTFAKGLRSIVRQDPDIILVGEIRDEETAGIAINSAMTGHLVLSTLHTNDAATAFPRLIDMGVEPYLIASTVNVVVAQRLIRKICQNCRISVDKEDYIKNSAVKTELLEKYLGDTSSFYKGKGCEVCHGSGYMGRLGIFEVLVVSEKIRQAITEQNDASVIRQLAVEEGMITIFEDGISKVKQGTTTLEEVLRVTKE